MFIAHVNLARGFSGGERQTLNLIRTLAEQHGIEQALVLRACSPMNQLIAGKPLIKLVVRNYLHGHSKYWTSEKIPDLLHAHDGKAVYWCLAHHKLWGVPYVITRRVDNPLRTKAVTTAAYQNAERVVCLSRAIEQQILQYPAEIKTQVIPSSFSLLPHDKAHSQAIRERYPGRFIIGQVGKLLEHKGFHITIEAARLLEKSQPQLKFLFIGDGEEEKVAELKQQAAGLGNLEFVGYRSDISDYIAALDLLVFPSLHEGLGSTILEAMALGVPVIGSQAGGIPDLITHEKTGLLVPPGNPQALADAIARLACSDEQRTQLVSAANRQLPGFSPESVAKRYLALYNSILPPYWTES